MSSQVDMVTRLRELIGLLQKCIPEYTKKLVVYIKYNMPRILWEYDSTEN
jgi:hypothetical protein